MKKNILLSLLGAFICTMVFNSCSKVASQLAQSLGWTGVDVTISVPPISDTTMQHASMAIGTFNYNLDSFIKAKTGNALGIKNVDTFRFTSCTLTITNPDTTDNFGNFQTALASFSTSTNTTTASLGEIDNNPSTYAATLTLPINNTTNLRSYIPNSGPVTINYSYGGKLRGKTTTTINIQAHVEYYIHVTP